MKHLVVEVKRLHADAVIPTYSTQGSSGFDLTTIESATLFEGETRALRTGLSFAVRDGWELQVRPRSSVALDGAIDVLFGTVDSDYRGEVKVIVRAATSVRLDAGLRLAQAVLSPVYRAVFREVQNLGATNRGTQGFGSSGK